MNASTGIKVETERTVQHQVEKLERMCGDPLFDLNDHLEVLGEERHTAETANLAVVEEPFEWTLRTIPEHLMEPGFALDNLRDLLALRIEQLENPNEVVIFDLPLQLDHGRYEGDTPVLVDTFHQAHIISHSISPSLMAQPINVPNGLFPVSFRLTIPPLSTQKEISHLCRKFENTVARYHRYLKAYEWTLSASKIQAAKDGNEIDEVLLHSECIDIYRKDVKKRIGALLLDNQEYWVPKNPED